MSGKFVITFIVENGDLEQKAALLLKSLVRNLKDNREKVDIIAIKPRLGKQLSNTTIQLFKENKVIYYDVDLNKNWKLPFANQAYATAFIESLYKDDVLLYLDSDIVCLNNPFNLSLTDKQKIGIAPDSFLRENVSILKGDKFDYYWKYLSCKLLNKEIEKKNFFTVYNAVDNKEVYAYFNSGVIIERTSLGIFNKWKQAFDLLSKDNEIKKWEKNNVKAYHFLDQIIISLLIVNECRIDEIKLLSKEFNFPFGLFYKVLLKGIKINFNEITFLHYHWQFYNISWLKYIEINKETKSFLLEYIPLQSGKHKIKFLDLIQHKILVFLNLMIYRIIHKIR